MKIISTTFSFTLIYELPTPSKTDLNWYTYSLYCRKLTLFAYMLIAFIEAVNNQLQGVLVTIIILMQSRVECIIFKQYYIFI